MAQVDYFLKIDGIKGESQDSKHKDEIDISSYGWEMTQTGTSKTGGGAGAGKVAVHDIEFNKQIDVSTPKLMEACATGTHVKSALFTARKAGKDQQEFFTITLTDLLISSVQHSQPLGSDALLPTECITLNFAKYEVSYKQQQADGTLGGAVKHGFSLKENKIV
jgi:type VI secretion system secreted protein Hcp